jgi:hypothetical protein
MITPRVGIQVSLFVGAKIIHRNFAKAAKIQTSHATPTKCAVMENFPIALRKFAKIFFKLLS